MPVPKRGARSAARGYIHGMSTQPPTIPPPFPGTPNIPEPSPPVIPEPYPPEEPLPSPQPDPGFPPNL